MLTFIIIIFVSALVQGMTGFGFSLVAMPFLTLFLSLKVIVPILVICSFALNLVIFSRIKGHLHLKRISLMFAVGVLSTPLGVHLLTIVDEQILKGLVGALIIFTSIIMMTGIQVTTKNKHLTYGLTGFLSGVLNGSVSLSGPPVVLMLVNEGEDKDNFKKNISGYFLALNTMTIPSFFMRGLITQEVIVYSTIGIFVLVIGALIGIRLGHTLKTEHFRKLVLLMITLMGIMTLVSIF